MKIEEAIKILVCNLIAEYACPDSSEEYIEALNMAIEALEKEIPKAPIDDPKAWLCPNCKSWVSHEQQRMYCRQCGQLIAWDKI